MSKIGKFIPRQQPPEIEVNDFIAQLQAGGVPVSQDALLNDALGITATNMRIDGAGTTQAPTGGAVHVMGIWLPGEITVSNILLKVATAGAGTSPTGLYVGLADPHGLVIAVSGNLNGSSLFTSTGLKEIPLSAPVTLSDAEVGLYYAMFLQVGSFGTTQVAFSRSFNWGGMGPNGSISYGEAGTGQSVIPPVGTQLTVATGGHNFFAGVD